MSANFNTDELVPPQWMDKAFFERALGSFCHDNGVIVKNFESKPATKVGDHFASIMFRVMIEYDSPKYKKIGERMSVILKTVPVMEGVKADFLKDSSAFRTEMQMYGKVLPEMERVLAASGDNTILGPRLIYQTSDPAPIIIMEDISVLGYEMTEKTLGFDDAKMVASRLAKFHAASMYLQANGMDLSNFTDSWIMSKVPGSDDTVVESFMLPTIDLLVEVVGEWEGDWSHVIEKLKNTRATMAEKLRNVYLGKNERTFSVLNHCDFHSKNMMFKKTEGKITELLLLDFQFCLWNSCSIDLAYFNFMVCNAEARERRAEMMQYYYDEFSGTLKKLGYLGRIPTLLDINIDYLKNGIIELMLTTGMMMLLFADFSQIKTEEMFDMTDPLAMHRITMRNPEYTKIMQEELKRMVGLGIVG
ncbi:uncharacterized protein LOC134835833 [Culicoides brevitarsis]|uniref:uncharacterized protein LOC134835833 n=1 Tax=Culicoides brevitarsis TaxID=469753 RepID=UPI00307C29BF